MQFTIWWTSPCVSDATWRHQFYQNHFLKMVKITNSQNGGILFFISVSHEITTTSHHQETWHSHSSRKEGVWLIIIQFIIHSLQIVHLAHVEGLTLSRNWTAAHSFQSQTTLIQFPPLERKASWRLRSTRSPLFFQEFLYQPAIFTNWIFPWKKELYRLGIHVHFTKSLHTSSLSFCDGH